MRQGFRSQLRPHGIDGNRGADIGDPPEGCVHWMPQLHREELRRTGDKHEAMAHATQRTGPAILSAGGTVFASMLVLVLAVRPLGLFGRPA